MRVKMAAVALALLLAAGQAAGCAHRAPDGEAAMRESWVDTDVLIAGGALAAVLAAALAAAGHGD